MACNSSPILGPKTEEEAREDQRQDDTLEQAWIGWCKNLRNLQRVAPVIINGKEWTPRWPDDKFEPDEVVHVKVYSHFDYDLFPEMDLRKAWEWQDFQFLVNVVLRGAPWEAVMAGEPWKNEERELRKKKS
jgi:hypothetical protein